MEQNLKSGQSSALRTFLKEHFEKPGHIIRLQNRLLRLRIFEIVTKYLIDELIIPPCYLVIIGLNPIDSC